MCLEVKLGKVNYVVFFSINKLSKGGQSSKKNYLDFRKNFFFMYQIGTNNWYTIKTRTT